MEWIMQANANFFGKPMQVRLRSDGMLYNVVNMTPEETEEKFEGWIDEPAKYPPTTKEWFRGLYGERAIDLEQVAT